MSDSKHLCCMSDSKHLCFVSESKRVCFMSDSKRDGTEPSHEAARNLAMKRPILQAT